MNNPILLGLSQNIAILLSFSMVHNYFWAWNNDRRTILFQIFSGLVLGAIGIILILTPWHYVPGIFFDTRSVMLSISGLFFGAIPTILAMLITGLYRIYIGGTGVLMGVTVIFTSGTIGLLWRYFRPGWKEKQHFWELAILGIVVHLVMISCTFLLPDEICWETFRTTAAPVILIYPPATLLFGLLMLSQEKHWENKNALNISEQRWQFAIEGSGDGIWDWNPLSNKMFFSKQWKNMLGYEDHEIESSFLEWKKRVFPEDIERVLKQLHRHMKGEIPVYTSEYRMYCKDGSSIWILDRGKIMSWNSDGKPTRIIGSHTNITEQKQAQEKIRRLNEELEQKVLNRTNELENRTKELSDNQRALLNLVEDLNEKSEDLTRKSEQLLAANKELEAFSYSVSHDLRAPLRAVNGFVQILQDEYGDKLDDEGKRLCNIIELNAVKMGQLIDDLLSFSRLIRSEIRKSAIDMNSLVNQAINEFRDDIKNRKIKFEIGKLYPFFGDVSMIRQVWINLISNAIKYSSKNEDTRITIGSEYQTNEIIYFISDNGIGFDMQYAHKLFGVFQRLHNIKEYDGTGVGLAIVQRIIIRHQGRVWAESTIGKGSTFYFAIPEMKDLTRE